MKIGIVGLPNVGKTTIFNALTRSHASSENYPFCTITPNIGAVDVPDHRLDRLVELIRPEKVIPAHVEFLDVAGLVEGASRGEGLGNQFLSNIRESRAIAQVVRCFSDDEVAYNLPLIEPVKELEIVATELLLSDLQVVERALRKKRGERKLTELLLRFREALARGRALREANLSREEMALVKEFQFLSLKPLIVVANIGEEQTGLAEGWLREVRRSAGGMGAEIVMICGKLEEELAELPDDEAAAFLEELNLSGRPLPRFIRSCYSLLGLIIFFTIEGGILQAWPVAEGTVAPRAAGCIHSDMERGFIKAEVITFENLERIRTIGEVRVKGLLRVEGKDYVVKDGDVIRFRFG